MNFDETKYDEILSHGLCSGERDGDKVCIKLALAIACGVADPSDAASATCTMDAANQFAIRLNDSSQWGSDAARAEGMRDLGVALIGTDHLSGVEFMWRLAEQTIRQIVPMALRAAVRAGAPVSLEAYAVKCETEGTKDAADAASNAYAVGDAARAASAAAYAVNAAAYAEPLRLSARIATEILNDMKKEKFTHA
jgi:hypothetical protein